MSASNRASNKDIYDLDYLTEKFPLIDLIELLKQKQERFHEKTGFSASMKGSCGDVTCDFYILFVFNIIFVTLFYNQAQEASSLFPLPSFLRQTE